MRINFGNIANVGDKTIMSGMASGLDVKSIVENTVKAKEIPINKLKDVIDLDNKKVSAYNQLTNLVSNFKKSAEILRNPPQFDKANDIFSLKQTTVTSNTSTLGNAYLGVAATNLSPTGNYQITNLSLATTNSQFAQNFSSNTSSVTASTPTSGLFNPGTFKINNVNITINPDDSLVDIQSSINFVANQTNVNASIIQISSNNFQLSLEAQSPGIANSFTIDDQNNCLANINWTNNSASDTSFTFNNILMTRPTNVVNDIIAGVTFNFYQAIPSGTVITASISSNPAAVENAIMSFVGSYNDIKTFIANQNQRDPISNKYTEDAILGGNNTLINIEQNIENELMSIVNGITTSSSDSRPINLAELGITFYDSVTNDTNVEIKNLLKVDTTILSTLLSTRFNDVKNVFGVNAISSNNNFLINKTSNDLNITSFYLNLDTSRTIGTQAKISYTDPLTLQAMTIDAVYTPNSDSSSGGVISIPAGQTKIDGTNNQISSPIDGLNIIYIGSSATAVSNFSISQGIAEKIYNLTKDILDPTNGTIDIAIDDVKSDITEKNDKINILESQIKYNKDKMLRQFADVEKAIAQANSIIEMIEANDYASRKNN